MPPKKLVLPLALAVTVVGTVAGCGDNRRVPPDACVTTNDSGARVPCPAPDAGPPDAPIV